jgi:hypothetical protein
MIRGDVELRVKDNHEETDTAHTENDLSKDPESISENGLAQESSTSLETWQPQPFRLSAQLTLVLCSFLPCFLGRCFRTPVSPVLRLFHIRLCTGFYWVDYQHPSSDSICQPWLYDLFPLILYSEFQGFSDF